MNRGNECGFVLRGVHPYASYVCTIGAYGGRWITISRVDIDEHLGNAALLGMSRLRSGDNVHFDFSEEITCECSVVGSEITLSVGDNALTVHDPCPLVGTGEFRVGLMTSESQLVLRKLDLSQRHAPLVVPVFALGNELMRHHLFYPAVERYQQVMEEHGDSEEAVQAHFMLGLALREAGDIDESIECFSEFLSQNIDHGFGQDAIFYLAKSQVEREDGSIERAVRCVLGYQETGDQVRSRFRSGRVIISARVAQHGLDAQIIMSFRALRHLIEGFADHQVIMQTLALVVERPLLLAWCRLRDMGAEEELQQQQDLLTLLRELGYPINRPKVYTASYYIDIARQLRSMTDMSQHFRSVQRLLRDAHSTGDFLQLVALGCSDILLHYLRLEEDPPPYLRLFRAALAKRSDFDDEARADCQFCFRLMDQVETERTDAQLAIVAQLAFYVMDLLPWDGVWESLGQRHDLIALAGWVAEIAGRVDDARQCYNRLHVIGTGYCAVAEQGIARLKMRQTKS